MKNQLSEYLDSLISLILYIVAAATPLLFLNLTTNFFDMPKLILLVVATLILLGLWFASWIVKGKITITRTPLDIPLIILLLVILASTFFSTSKYASIYGIFPEVHGSAVSWVTYILLYFVTTSNLKEGGQVRIFLQVLFGSVTIVALVSFLSFFGVFLPFDIAKSVNFSPTGSAFSASALMLMLLPLALISAVKKNKLMPQPLAVFASLLFSVTIVLIGSVTTYVILLLVFALSLFVVKDHLNGKTLTFFLAPFTFALIFLALTLIPFPGNKLHEVRTNFPQEIQLPFDISWKISASAFRDAPFSGTGPATYLYDFTSYKPVEFNQLKFWNFSFGTAYNELFQVLATWGVLGLLAFIALGAIVFNISKRNMTKNSEGILLPGLALGGMVVLALLLVHTSTLVSIVITLFVAALLMVSEKERRVFEFSTGFKIATSGNKQIDLLPIVIFIAYLGAALVLGSKSLDVVRADYYHRLALTQADKDGTKTYEYLQKAEAFNPYIDLYRVDLAQTNFALANALASQKGPTEDNPEGSLTDTDKQNIQTLVTQAINEGRASVALAPRSARNWEVLAIIYRNITGVAGNSLTFALDAYGRAIQADPLNPTLRVNAGSIYHSTKNYDQAIRFYTDSINLKPDYVNGYYNLAVVFKDKGDLKNAQLVAEQAVALLRKDLSSEEYSKASELLKDTWVKDFNTASELLNEIKGKVNEGAPTQNETALQNPELPAIDVPSLENPPQTTTPPSVGENPETVLPETNPVEVLTPTQTP